MRFATGILALPAMIAVHTALACEPKVVGFFDDYVREYRKPIDVQADCSFKEVFLVRKQITRVVSTYAAGAAHDLGNGLVAQRLTDGTGICSEIERLLVVDCATGEKVALEGRLPPGGDDGSGFRERRISEIQWPKGPVRLGPETTIDGLVALADAEGISLVRDIDKQVLELRRRNRFDPACGCKLFYPDLAETSQ